MKRSRTENSPWIKSKTKPGLNMKKIDEFHSDRKQNLAESDKGSWFNQLSESEAASASSLKIVYQQSEESNVTRERLPKRVRIVLRRRILSCLLAFLKLRCGTFSSVCFCFVEVLFFPFVLSFVEHG